MRRFGSNGKEMGDLEQRLRDERPEPRDELVRQLSVTAEPAPVRPARPRMRLATALAVGLLGVMGAGAVADPGGDPNENAQQNYATTFNVCHRADNEQYVQLRLPLEGAAHHLANHPGDYPGTCIEQVNNVMNTVH